MGIMIINVKFLTYNIYVTFKNSYYQNYKEYFNMRKCLQIRQYYGLITDLKTITFKTIILDIEHNAELKVVFPTQYTVFYCSICLKKSQAYRKVEE